MICLFVWQYGFTSFVHRDHAYKVLQLIWQNSQLHQVCPHDLSPLKGIIFLPSYFIQPSGHETLRNQLTYLFTTQHSPPAGRPKSSSFSSDIESSGVITSTPPSNHSRSSSFPSTPNTSDSFSKPHLPHLLAPSESDLGTESDDMITPREQVDGVLSRLQHQFVAVSSSSSRSGSEEEEGTVPHSSPASSAHELNQSSDQDLQQTSDSSLINRSSVRNILTKSSSQSTLRPPIPDTDTPVQSQALLGGSPNFLHHWKRTLSIRTLWQNVVTIARPQHLVQLCTPSRLINMLIILL